LVIGDLVIAALARVLFLQRQPLVGMAGSAAIQGWLWENLGVFALAGLMLNRHDASAAA
jgi:hypothetical protein